MKKSFSSKGLSMDAQTALEKSDAALAPKGMDKMVTKQFKDLNDSAGTGQYDSSLAGIDKEISQSSAMVKNQKYNG